MGKKRSEMTGRITAGGGGGWLAKNSKTPLTVEELKFLELLKLQSVTV